MSYKSILVHVDGSPEAERRLAVAAKLAARFDAHLAGIAVVPPLELPQRLRSHAGAKAILEEEFAKALAAAQSLVNAFPAQARAAGAPSAEARLVQGEAVEALAGAARTADLVVLSQPDRDDLGALGNHFIERAATEVGRPILLVPLEGNVTDIGRRILIAWKNAGASARALADARPLLQQAESVTALAVDEDGDGASPQEALDYVQRHGAKADGVTVKGESAGREIVSHASRIGADLVVMGALARPRLTEMILGGATRTVLQTATTCVLMSH